MFKIKTMRSKYFLKCWPSQPPGVTYCVILEPDRTFKLNIFLQAMHYRLRWPLGRSLSQKMLKSEVSFLSEKDIFVRMKWSMRKWWPRFLTQKIATNIQKRKFADITQTQNRKKLKRGLWLRSLSWWNQTFEITNICATIPG